nr:hypothetical protein [Tanacetum cinerariifolium]
MKVHYGGKFTSRPNRKYVLVPNKTLDWGLKALGNDDDIVNLIKVLRGIMHLGVEMGSEHGGAEEEFSDHDDDNIVDEEHIIDELKNKWPTTLLPPKVVVPVGRPPKKERGVLVRLKLWSSVERWVGKACKSLVKIAKAKDTTKEGTPATRPRVATHSASKSSACTPANPSATREIAGTPATTSATRVIVGTPSATKASASTPAATSSQKMTKRFANRRFSPTKKA